jgi:hypothetical protein
MILYISTFIIIVLIALGIAFVSYKVSSNKFKKAQKSKMSFKEAMDLAGLPVVTFYQGNCKFNFLLDTGSDLSHINTRVKSIKGELHDCNLNISGLGSGSSSKYKSCKLSYNKLEFDVDLYLTDFTEAFKYIKETTGVQIHGILGSKFFRDYAYILNFDELIAYSNK